MESVRTTPLTVRRAREIVRDHIREEIASGRIEPMEGARAINQQWTQLAYPARLSTFIYLYEVAEDYPHRRPEAEAEMVDLPGASYEMSRCAVLANASNFVSSYSSSQPGKAMSIGTTPKSSWSQFCTECGASSKQFFS